MFLELLQRAEHLRLAAQATRLRREARRQEWAAWSGLMAHFRLAPDPLVVACVYCFRVRTLDGVWRVPSRALSAYVRHKQLISHSYCSECLRARGLE
jgi:hypothetical protein